MVKESEWEALSDWIGNFDNERVRNEGSFEKTLIFKLTEKQQSFRKQPLLKRGEAISSFQKDVQLCWILME